METINYNGNTYQLGMAYLFRDSLLDSPKFGVLLDIDTGDNYPFTAKCASWKICEELPPSNEIGTITPEPIELIDGKAYQFESYKQELHGIYSTECEKMFTQNGEFRIKDCKRIKPLTVEIK